MALKRMDNVLIVVEDLETVKAFFIELDKFHTPKPVRFGPIDTPVNALGIRRVMFSVEGIIVGLAEEIQKMSPGREKRAARPKPVSRAKAAGRKKPPAKAAGREKSGRPEDSVARAGLNV